MSNKMLLTGLILAATPLIGAVKVLTFSGSTRDGSYNKMLVREAGDMARQAGAKVTAIDLKDFPMPFYDADLEAKQKLPPSAKRLRQLMIDSDAIIISTPEYNASLPAVLKNALDWASRGEDGKPSRDAFKGKKFALMSASPGGLGGSRALAHLSAVIENVGGEVVTERLSIPQAHDAFDNKGQLKSSELKKQLQQEIDELLSVPATNNATEE